MKQTMKFLGGKELDRALQELANKRLARKTEERALTRAAEPIRQRWHDLAPEDQGDLKRSIKIGKAIKGIQRKDRGTATIYVGIDESVDPRLHIYAEVQEFGNDSDPAQPAGRPAFEEKKEESLEQLGDDLWDEIRKTAERQARKQAKG